MTWTVSFRDAESTAPAAPLDWDTVMVDGDELAFDWALAPLDGSPDSGGLVSRAAIATAVILSLFTDARAPDGWRTEVQDRRGWWGDGMTPAGTEPFGSWLWTVLEQAIVSDAMAADARREAERALAWMVRDRVAGSVTVTATPSPADRRLDLRIEIRSTSGAVIHDRTFDILWRQT